MKVTWDSLAKLKEVKEACVAYLPNQLDRRQ
jgi:hypothetical protein